MKESDILRVIEEDILRIVGERKKRVLLRFIRTKIKVSYPFLSKAIESLEEAGLICIEKESIRLTEKGRNEAEDIVQKHLVLEKYFRENRSQRKAHQAAHLLEHYVSREVMNNLKKIFTLKKEGVPLIEFGLKKEGLITDILSSDYKLFERLISMGILPGEAIEVIHKIPNGVIVEIKNKKIVLDRSIAKEIRVLDVGI